MTASGDAATILVTGGRGQVGGALARLAAARGLSVRAPARAELDLSQPASVAAAAERSWRAIVNCGAFTAVDVAETETALADAVNAIAPGLLARGAARTGTPLVHLSTDYVFDGTKGEPYGEDDPVRPVNAYGRGKAEGERAVLDASPSHAVVRTSWVLSGGGRNFLTTMLRLGRERDALNVVDDQIGSPTGAEDLAEAVLRLLDAGETGLWHFVNGGTTSWYGLARHIFAHPSQTGAEGPEVLPIATADYPTPARRPLDSRLSTARWTSRFGPPRRWEAAVDDILARLAAGPEGAARR